MKPFVLGLTGSIGTGKSTASAMFAEAGLPIWDADAAVHRLYAENGGGAQALASDFPEAIAAGAVSREALKRILAADPSRLARLEQIIHPMVSADRKKFVAQTKSDIVVLDIPLLFETGAEAECDATLLITAPADLQKARVMARPGMTDQQFSLILSRQLSEQEKRTRATHIVETLSFDSTRSYIQALIAYILAGRKDA